MFDRRKNRSQRVDLTLTIEASEAEDPRELLMSLSSESFEYHLTPRGWVEGSQKLDFGAVRHRETPQDRVLTLIRFEKIACFSCEMEVTEKEVWRSDDPGMIKTLTRKFGSAPSFFLQEA